MVEIVEHTEYSARAMKEPDIDKQIPGYNFAYPIMNTIEIGSLFISGGSIDIHSERMKMSKWSFDKETSTLTIEKSSRIQSYIISDTKELYNEMSKYFNANKQKILEKSKEILLKKSKGLTGNQNASKDNSSAMSDISNEPTEFCDGFEYISKSKGKTLKDYYTWVIKNGWWDKLNPDNQYKAKGLGLYNE